MVRLVWLDYLVQESLYELVAKQNALVEKCAEACVSPEYRVVGPVDVGLHEQIETRSGADVKVEVIRGDRFAQVLNGLGVVSPEIFHSHDHVTRGHVRGTILRGSVTDEPYTLNHPHQNQRGEFLMGEPVRYMAFDREVGTELLLHGNHVHGGAVRISGPQDILRIVPQTNRVAYDVGLLDLSADPRNDVAHHVCVVAREREALSAENGPVLHDVQVERCIATRNGWYVEIFGHGERKNACEMMHDVKNERSMSPANN